MRWKARHLSTRSTRRRSLGWLGGLALATAAIVAAAVMSGEAAGPATGACCTRATVDPLTWSCQKITAAQCDQLCGVYHGDGSKCQQVNCAAGPVRTCVDRATKVEIAGSSLPSKPFFTNFTAFRSNKSVEASLDPTRFPALAGLTCDVYLVNARDDAEWSANDSLVGSDVRSVCPDGVTDPNVTPCAFTFPSQGATLGDYQFTLASPGPQLDDIAAGAEPCYATSTGEEKCLGVGAGLDVVLDCNRDGVLGAGDYADGLGVDAGLYVTHDTASAGPLGFAFVDANVPVPGFPKQRIYYPDPDHIESLGLMPLVVISHGAGHTYEMYDYIGRHLASYGYLVMIHQNDQSSPDNGGRKTLQHSAALLELLAGPNCPGTAPPEVCNLIGRVDSGRIVWIGHSRGGEGVVWAYDRLYDCAPEYDENDPACDFGGSDPLPVHVRADDIALVVSLAPTAALAAGDSDPHDVPYALIYGASDQQVPGCAQAGTEWPFRLFERAIGRRQSLYIHGVGHNPLHDCEPCSNPPAGPGQLSLTETHEVVTGYLVSLLDHYVRGGRATVDYMSRPWEQFRPSAVDSSTVAALDYRNGLDPEVLVIDNFQVGDLSVSSDGSTVFCEDPASPDSNCPNDVNQPFEGIMRDGDCAFKWAANTGSCDADPSSFDRMNGMTRAREGDNARGVVLGWSGPRQYGYDFEAPRDFSRHAYVSFRAAQPTRYLQVCSSLSFSIALEDEYHNRVSLSISPYGSSIGCPYGRKDAEATCIVQSDDRPGWQNEFETVRIPLRDFQANGSQLHLDQIVELAFEFGNLGESPAGRVAIDDVELTSDSFRPQPQPCPRVQPCDASCNRSAQPVNLVDQGAHECRLDSGELFQCDEASVTIATYSCAQPACCTSTPACVCETPCPPVGTYLECR